jgi:CubicO group peptidase (beta-lactamase class C family)
MTATIAAFLALLLLPSAQASRRETLARAYPEIDRLFRQYASEAHVPGAAWGVIVDGELVHTGVTGYRDIPAKSPVTPDTVFRIASMTKSFTAMAILKLRGRS